MERVIYTHYSQQTTAKRSRNTPHPQNTKITSFHGPRFGPIRPIFYTCILYRNIGVATSKIFICHCLRPELPGRYRRPVRGNSDSRFRRAVRGNSDGACHPRGMANSSPFASQRGVGGRRSRVYCKSLPILHINTNYSKQRIIPRQVIRDAEV